MLDVVEGDELDVSSSPGKVVMTPCVVDGDAEVEVDAEVDAEVEVEADAAVVGFEMDQLSVVAVENATAMPTDDRPLHVYREEKMMYAATQEAWLAQALRHRQRNSEDDTELTLSSTIWNTRLLASLPF
jgi:phosphohistidine swiveling domain-containing protein